MKILALLLVFVLLTGCTTINSTLRKTAETIQTALGVALPPEFKGEAYINHENQAFGFTLRAGGLRKTPSGWAWDWLIWKRRGTVWTGGGTVIFGTPPQHYIQ